MIAIKSCTCKSDYQDKLYGKGKRVMNDTGRRSVNGIVYCCTVCKKEK